MKFNSRMPRSQLENPIWLFTRADDVRLAVGQVWSLNTYRKPDWFMIVLPKRFSFQSHCKPLWWNLCCTSAKFTQSSHPSKLISFLLVSLNEAQGCKDSQSLVNAHIFPGWGGVYFISIFWGKAQLSRILPHCSDLLVSILRELPVSGCSYSSGSQLKALCLLLDSGLYSGEESCLGSASKWHLLGGSPISSYSLEGFSHSLQATSSAEPPAPWLSQMRRKGNIWRCARMS